MSNIGKSQCHQPWLWGLGCIQLLLLAFGAGSGLAQPVCRVPYITDEPKDLIVLAGTTATFSVRVFDQGPACTTYYAWRHFDFYILGATNPTITLGKVQPPPVGNTLGSYSVLVTNVGGLTNSSVANLTIVSGPSPSHLSVAWGATATFSVAVFDFRTSDPTYYQWQFNGQDLPGATGSTLTLSNVQPCQTGAYAVTVSNPAGSVTTSNALLGVEVPPPRLDSVMWTADGYLLQVSGPPNATYRIQATEDWSTWIDIATNTVPASGWFEVLDPQAFLFSGRFYRALTP